jgi:hypothetical protein
MCKFAEIASRVSFLCQIDVFIVCIKLSTQPVLLLSVSSWTDSQPFYLLLPSCTDNQPYYFCVQSWKSSKRCFCSVSSWTYCQHNIFSESNWLDNQHWYVCVRLDIQAVLLLPCPVVQTALTSFRQVVRTTSPIYFCVPVDKLQVLFLFCLKLYSLSALFPPSVKLATHISTA